MGNRFLELLPVISPFLANLWPQGSAIFACDTEKFVYKDEHNFTVPFAVVGKEFSPSGSVAKALQTRQQTVMELDASLYGVALRATTTPLFDDDDPHKVIGAWGVAIPRDDVFALRKISDALLQGLNEISSAIEETAAAAGEINLSEQHLNDKIVAIQTTSNEITKILDFIKEVANETKMLGLNAAIEAARAGEFGRGFGVVAEEIRKLSEVSKVNSERIREQTQIIVQRIADAAEDSKVTLNASQEQAAAAQEVTASIQELTSLTEQLDKITRKI
ncbi:MAG: methyl-accepting chemotaxis protein [Candidatus Saccharibacteria bacterium]